MSKFNYTREQLKESCPINQSIYVSYRWKLCVFYKKPYFNSLVAAISQHIGSDTAAGLGAAFGLTNPDEIGLLLSSAGFSAIEITATELELELPVLEEFVPKHIGATPMTVGYSAASQAAQQAVVDDLITELSQFEHTNGLRVPFRSYMGVGMLPTDSEVKMDFRVRPSPQNRSEGGSYFMTTSEEFAQLRLRFAVRAAYN